MHEVKMTFSWSAAVAQIVSIVVVIALVYLLYHFIKKKK